MKQVIEDSDPTRAPESELTVAQKKGVLARRTIQDFSGESAVCKMNERLRFHAERRGYVL